MTLYKWVLVLAILTIIVLFAYPRVSAHAQVVLGSPVLGPTVSVPSLSIQQQIVYWSHVYKISPTIPLAIAECESQYHSQAHNPLSTAKGVYQFLDGTWAYYAKLHWGEVGSVLNGEDNAELGVWVIAHYGADDWLASKWCWLPRSKQGV